MYVFLLFIAGLLQGLMVSLNGQLSHYFNVFEVSFFVHLTGVVLVSLYAFLIEKKHPRFGGAPLYIYVVGFLGITVVASGSFCSAHIGAAASLAISVVGQMIMSACIDHFGWFHTKKVPFRLKRLPAFLLTAAGVLLIVFG